MQKGRALQRGDARGRVTAGLPLPGHSSPGPSPVPSHIQHKILTLLIPPGCNPVPGCTQDHVKNPFSPWP